jgi:hypothetical protein
MPKRRNSETRENAAEELLQSKKTEEGRNHKWYGFTYRRRKTQWNGEAQLKHSSSGERKAKWNIQEDELGK